MKVSQPIVRKIRQKAFRKDLLNDDTKHASSSVNYGGGSVIAVIYMVASCMAAK